MLGKLETLYLGVLRGFILIVATLALVAAVLLIVTSVPQLMTRMGLTASEPQSSSLAEFIAEQKPVGDPVEGEAVGAELLVNPVIRDAAQNFHGYLGQRATATAKDWEQGLQRYRDSFPIDIADDYAISVRRLSEELRASRGKPLSEQRVGALVEWHKNRFAENQAAEVAERAAADAAFKLKIASAFGAFMLFVFITFIFLFVRIERNLRLVRVQVGEPYAQPD